MEENVQIEVNTKEHEVTFLLKNEDISPIRRAAQAAGLVIKNEDQPLAKVKLAYPIKKNNYAFLGNLSFNGEQEKLELFSRELKLESDVIRYMITRVDKALPASAKSLRNATSRHRFVSRPKKAVTESILTNEAIEKKIEEIMK